MNAPQRAGRWLGSVLSDHLDRSVVLQLGGVFVEQPAMLDVSPVEPRAFWEATRVADPRNVWVERSWESFDGRGWHEHELAGDSAGPGTHRGSRLLYATAHVGPRGAAAPLVVLLHGYAFPFTGFDRWIAWRLRRRGAHTVRLELPFHFRRAVPREHSGDHFFSLDPAHLRAVLRQSVEDAAAVVAWARREVTPDVRVMGTSLGGLVGLLLSALVPMDRALTVAPLCDAPVSFTESRAGAMQRYMGMIGKAARSWGADQASVRDVLSASLAPIVPKRLRPVTPPERITIVESAGDRIVGAEPMEELARVWGTKLWRYPHGHITVMNAPGLPTRIVGHLAAPAGADSPDGLALAG